MNDEFEVRDMRNKEKFFVNDEYLNGYAKICGPNATLVYLCLCRHSDRYQESFPSVKTMADKTGISPRSIIRGIQILIEWNIVRKERERKKDSTWLNNRYLLLDKSSWKSKPSATQSHGEPSAKSDKSQVPHSHTKDTHTYKDTHITVSNSKELRDIEEVINLFKNINPSYSKFFSNKTQRAAVSRLLIQWPRPKLDNIISIIPDTNKHQYAPTITTPFELENKMASLRAFIEKQRNSNNVTVKIS